MVDYKTTIIGICAAFITVLTIITNIVQGKPIDLPTVTAAVNSLLLALGLYQAADTKKP
jgi:hypothetical protein